MIKDEPFKLSVNGQTEFSMQPIDANELDVLTESDGTFHVLKDGISYHAELVEADYAERAFKFRIAGNIYSVRIADHYERLIKQLGFSVGGVQKMNNVKAPMPGLVVDILVKVGQEIKKGDSLVILEAMKMENVLKATGDAKVKSILISKGGAVTKGQIMIEFE
jgi:biotin carboxyl carrier protein